jgi:hypothetical protein
MNSDGAFAVTEGVAGGGIARDNGGFKGAWFKVYQAMTDPLTIEVVALETLLFLRGRRIISGSLLRSTVPSSSASGAHVREIDR